MTHQYKVGDKVRALVDRLDITKGNIYTVTWAGKIWVSFSDDVGGNTTIYASCVEPVRDTPKTWGDMTDEERTPILLAFARGRVVERQYADGVWTVEDGNPKYWEKLPRRIKPDPVVEVIERSVFTIGVDTFNVAVTLTDGKATAVELVE